MICRRCSECEGMTHHWMPDPMPYTAESWAPGDYACKHCAARGNDCPKCDGEGSDHPEPQGPGICPKCKGEGVLILTEQEFAHEIQVRAAGL